MDATLFMGHRYGDSLRSYDNLLLLLLRGGAWWGNNKCSWPNVKQFEVKGEVSVIF